MSNDEERLKFVKESISIIKTLKSAVDIDYYVEYLSKESNISIESLKKEIYGKNYKSSYNPTYKKNQFIKKDEKALEKPSIASNGNELTEKTLLKLIIENSDFRKIAILKLNCNDFIFKENKEILNFIIKNEDLDKITIDKLKDSNLSEEYLKGLFDISLENINLNDNKSLDEIIRKIKRNKLQHDIDVLLKEQRDLEIHRNDDNKDAKEVDVKVMEIALKIVELRRILQKV